MKLSKNFLALTGLLAVVMTITNCTTKAPDLTAAPRPPAAAPPPPPPKKAEPQVFEKAFYFSRSEASAEQNKYDNNQITIPFRVTDKGENSIDRLTERDFRVSENNVTVEKFTVEANEKETKQVADIVFVVDITGSMGPFIQSAKLVLKKFIESTGDQYHIRMCLSTFGDFVVKKCNRFFDSTRPAQVKEFISELSKLKATKAQAEDPRYLDWEENPMRALTEATVSPWAQDSQRFVILVSDADFYSPDKPSKFIEQHQANENTRAPSMKEINLAIRKSGVNVFTVTPPATGYNSPLNNEPDITASSNGQWYEFNRVMAGEITLESILNNIKNRINTTYKLTYVIEQNQGLDPALPVSSRNIQIALANGNGQVKQGKVISSMPTGRPQYKKTWKVSDKAIQQGSMKVSIDGQEVDPRAYSVQGGNVQFNDVPKAGAKLNFVFLYEDITENFRFEPLTFKGGLNNGNTKVYLNGKEARKEEVELETDMKGDTTLNLADSVMGSNDPYDIRKNESLKIRVVVE